MSTRGPVLLFRTPSGEGGIDIDVESVCTVVRRLASVLAPECLTETQWIVAPDTHLGIAKWPEHFDTS